MTDPESKPLRDPSLNPTPSQVTAAAGAPSASDLPLKGPDGEFLSHCIRCGKPTPPGVSLCDADNPGHIKAPSATQVHGTMLLGVGIGALLFLLLAQLAVRHEGPFTGAVQNYLILPTGSVEVHLIVSNAGANDSIANCRVTRDGAPRPDDLVIRTDSIPAGGSVQLTRDLPIPQEAPNYDGTKITLLCT